MPRLDTNKVSATLLGSQLKDALISILTIIGRETMAFLSWKQSKTALWLSYLFTAKLLMMPGANISECELCQGGCEQEELFSDLLSQSWC